MTTILTEPRSAYVGAPGSRLRYLVHGDRESPVVVLVHGMRDHGRSWDWIAGALAKGYSVIAPDLRGHGESFHAAPQAYGIAAFVSDLATLADALELEDFALVGHSLGGAIAIRYAAAFPERVRALCAIEAIELPVVREERDTPTPYPLRLKNWILAERERAARSPRGYATLAEPLERMSREHPDLDQATIAHLVEHAVTRDRGGAWRWKYDNAARLRAPDDADGRDLDQTLAAIACPTLLAYGDDSWIPLPPAERLALIDDCRIVTFPGASHWLHHQSRDAFIAALLPFLESCTKGLTHA